MADEGVAAWSAQVRAALRRTTGTWVDAAEQQWDRHDRSGSVHVAVHGAYNAGKSSLLKRLLAEDGTPCPPWLVVGARPTTFEVQSVESGGLVWVDTPGTGTGDPRHDQMANDALVLTDAVLVVLNPQLQSGDVRQIVGLLDSTFYSPLAERSLFPEGALLLVVGLMDAAGVSPRADLVGYRALVARKEEELRAALDAEAATATRPPLHLVAADARQIGRRDQVVAADYASSADWDGIADLRRDLHALPGRLAELRAGAQLRYWSRLAEQARQGAVEESEQLDEVLDEAERQRTRVRLWLQELDSLDRKARSELEERLYRDLTTAGTPGADAEAARILLEVRVAAVVADWTAEFGAALDQLATSASREQQVQLARPGAGALRRYIDDLLDARAALTDTRGADRVDRLLDQFEPHAKAVARGGFKLLHGLSVEEARAELAHLRHLDEENLARYFARTDTPFADAEQRDRIKAGVRRLEVVEELLPVALSLASLVADEFRDQRAERRRLQLRYEVREHARRIAERILDGGGKLDAWGDAVASLREAFTSLAPDETTVAEAEARNGVLGEVVGRLGELLAAPPQPERDG